MRMDRNLHKNSHWEVKQCTVSILWSAVPMEDRPSALASAHASESHMHASTVYYTQKFCSEIGGFNISFIRKNETCHPERGFREISGCYCGAREISPNVRFLWVWAAGLGVSQDILPSSPLLLLSPCSVHIVTTSMYAPHNALETNLVLHPLPSSLSFDPRGYSGGLSDFGASLWVKEYFEIGFMHLWRNILRLLLQGLGGISSE